MRTATMLGVASSRARGLPLLMLGAVSLLLLSTPIISKISHAQDPIASTMECIRLAEPILDSFVADPPETSPEDVCRTILDLSLCLSNITIPDQDAPPIINELIKVGQGLIYTFNQQLSCDSIDHLLWDAFLPLDNLGPVRPAEEIATNETLCAFKNPVNGNTFDISILSGAANIPRPGVTGIPSSCSHQRDCPTLYRASPCEPLPCGVNISSAACTFQNQASFSVANLQQFTSIGRYDSREFLIINETALMLLTYDTSSALPQALRPILSSLLGPSFAPLIDTALDSPSNLFRTRMQFVCSPATNRLPRLDTIEVKTTSGILNDVLFTIDHRCACPNAQNCTWLPPQRHPSQFRNCTSVTLDTAILGSAISLVILFILLEKRIYFKPKFLGGFISLPTVYNFLENRSHRWLPVFCYALFATLLFANFFSLIFQSNTEWYSSLVTLVKAIGQSFTPAPFLFASTCRFQHVGMVLGLIYGVLFLVSIVQLHQCFASNLPSLTPISGIALFFLMCVLLLMCCYLASDVKSRLLHNLGWLTPTRRTGHRRELDPLRYYEGHVKTLLAPGGIHEAQPILPGDSFSKKTLKKALRFLGLLNYRTNPRLLASILISLSWIALFTIVIIQTGAPVVKALLSSALNTGRDLYCLALPGYVIFPRSSLPVGISLGFGCKTNETIGVVFFWVIIGAALITAITLIIFISFLFSHHRKKLKEIYAGVCRDLPKKLPSADSAVTKSVKYIGYQIAHTYTSYLVLYVVYFLILAAIAVFIVLPILDIIPAYLWDFISVQAPPFIFSLVFAYAQLYFVHYIFLEHRRSVGIRNRNAFHLFDFLFFIFNAIFGALLFLKRWLYTMLFAVLFISRLDVTTFPRGYEGYDSSYSVYLGFLLVDAYYSNPTMITFARLLLNSLPSYSGDQRHEASQQVRRHRAVRPAYQAKLEIDEAESNDAYLVQDGTLLGESETDDVDAIAKKRRLVARNRWFLALTLSRNPRLAAMRRSNKTGNTHWYL